MGLSNHQLIYCTRKFSCTNAGIHKQIALPNKHYTAGAYKEALSKVCILNDENFSDVNEAYENLIQKLTSLISWHLLELNELKIIYENGLMEKFQKV